MLDVKDYQCIDMVFPSRFAYVEKAARYIEEPELKNMDTIYSETLFELCFRNSKWSWDLKAWISSHKMGGEGIEGGNGSLVRRPL